MAFRLPVIPLPIRTRVHRLGRQPTAAVPLKRLPAVWGLSEAEAAAALTELLERGMARLCPGLMTDRRVALTDFGALVAGVRLADDGVRWVPL